MCLFNSLIYVKSWLTAPREVDAPSNDLQLWNDLNDFINVDLEIADAAITAMERHFWYLTEECVPFVLFFDQISAAVKNDKCSKSRVRKP